MPHRDTENPVAVYDRAPKFLCLVRLTELEVNQLSPTSLRPLILCFHSTRWSNLKGIIGKYQWTQACWFDSFHLALSWWTANAKLSALISHPSAKLLDASLSLKKTFLDCALASLKMDYQWLGDKLWSGDFRCTTWNLLSFHTSKVYSAHEIPCAVR